MIEYAMNTTGMTPDQIEDAHAAICPNCGAQLVVGSWPFCKGGHAPADRLFNVIGDECDIWQENFSATPEHFDSKREMARRAKELGLIPMVRHVGENHTDKSSKTSRWI